MKRIHGEVCLSVRERSVLVPNLDFERCSNCGEELFDAEASRKIDEAVEAKKPARRRKMV